MVKSIIEMDKNELLDYLKEHPDKFKSLYTEENISKINWNYIPRELIDKNKTILKNFDWEEISRYHKLSESFIAKHKNLVDWDYISVNQKFSESFIAKHNNLVNWKHISEYQKLSEAFITEYKDLINWKEISTYQKLSESFITEYKNYLIMCLVNDNWLNKTTEFKKEAVVKTGLYECYEDYFIAYKGIRSDRYSKFNFQYQYMPGETYECFSDGSDNNGSFGLSVWTKEEATEYCDELVVRCKIYYKDVTRVVHSDCKIRCSKITILD